MVLFGRVHEARARELRPDDGVGSEQLLDRGRDVHGHRDLGVGRRFGEQGDDREQQFLVLEDVPGVVDHS